MFLVISVLRVNMLKFKKYIHEKNNTSKINNAFRNAKK